jgi:hypothetical protein
MAIFYTDTASFNSLSITGSTVMSASSNNEALKLIGSNSTIFSVTGSSGGLFAITDAPPSNANLFSVSSGSITIFSIDFLQNVNISGSTVITGTLNVTAGITGSLLGTSSFCETAVSAITAQSASNFNISNTLVIDKTLTDYATVALTAFPATNNVFTQATGSYRSAFFKYTAYTASSAARSGEIIASWNGGVVTYTDFSTVDVGDTTGVVATVALAGNDVQLNVVTPAAKWTIKSLATFI